jgi:PKD repeat protein
MKDASFRKLVHLAIAVALAIVSGFACTMKSQEEPPLAGPSEFGQAISVSVSPDVLTQDGASQSLVTVTARDANGGPIRNLSLRGEIVVGGVSADFGSLSARNVVTGADGRAAFVYTAPPAAMVAVDEFTIVNIFVTPIGTNFDNSSSRSASIRLVPPGMVIPPDGLVPNFTFSPSAPLENQSVLFDATSSRGAIVEYRWDFGDGERSSGRVDTHDFEIAGNYSVTLTIVDPFDRTASITKQVSVGVGANPTAAFAISPTDPIPGQPVFFNGSTSTAPPGREIVSWEWDFGDGSTGTGMRVTRTYPVSGTYTVTLVVTDDGGRRGVTTQQVPVKFPDVEELTKRPGGLGGGN